jgi:hypothetical protein
VKAVKLRSSEAPKLRSSVAPVKQRKEGKDNTSAVLTEGSDRKSLSALPVVVDVEGGEFGIAFTSRLLELAFRGVGPAVAAAYVGPVGLRAAQGTDADASLASGPVLAHDVRAEL